MFYTLVTTKYCTTAALGFLIYDSLIVFDSEVEYIWKRPISSGKLLYLWNRYFGLCVVIFNTTKYFCIPIQQQEMDFGFQLWEGISIMISLLTLDLILQTRIYAIYGRSKLLLCIMAAVFLGAIVITLLMFVTYMSGEKILLASKACFALWMPSLAVESFLCLLMVFKAWTLYKQQLRSRLLNVLVRDSVVHYLTVSATILMNYLGWDAEGQYSSFGISLTIAVPCVLGSRLLINMNEQYFKEQAALSPGGRSRTEDDLGVECDVFSSIIDENSFDSCSHMTWQAEDRASEESQPASLP